MGHAVSRKTSLAKKLETTMRINEAPLPIASERGAPVAAAAHEKQCGDDSQEGLTEEMIEGLTRSSVGSTHSKAKDTVNDWITVANYFVKHNTDALKQHEESMRTLAAMQAAQHNLRSFSKPNLNAPSRSKDSRNHAAIVITRSHS
ncbi:hypothetical protein, unknown function [Leishmania donovani]|uniref:Uncharacterized protein n=1 Tax=Leishmania donovani TaxID=5661 RepID=A0A3Q8IBH9_LEIDO|nr:hypothetical protein, unknown function [Leishmania donovani]AYU79306.1 hypothetical protein LdCL_240028000 [Leishmania donovani]TPP52344.1 hypothetical protein CGC21_16695 [Leishmania donovani]CBZ34612.1 hypothetical protein, unknown function [Leishmania donovani]